MTTSRSEPTPQEVSAALAAAGHELYAQYVLHWDKHREAYIREIQYLRQRAADLEAKLAPARYEVQYLPRAPADSDG
jgi:hypothetical protein